MSIFILSHSTNHSDESILSVHSTLELAQEAGDKYKDVLYGWLILEEWELESKVPSCRWIKSFHLNPVKFVDWTLNA